ncbi:hypothetical protein L1987_44069 [Smallanthus sonchifolius]|uniref:Uncharacterized protein n=1 Tax=Smallanthus sonchifolius TaxID=185202 RepID=A0ACB9GPM3_9ASTR|nr:hypothetical protein L1987_44069 [Smallanthus sonchifolius]
MAAEKELLCNLRCTIDQTLFDVTDGGIEEDIIKCLAYRGDFSLCCADLRSKGLNRVGSLLVPNENYCYEAPKLRYFVKGCEDVRKVVADLKSKRASAVGVAGFCWGGAVDSPQLWLLECVVYIMEQCVSRLDVAMFNAILREPGDEIPTDPLLDAISDSRFLSIPSGKQLLELVHY